MVSFIICEKFNLIFRKSIFSASNFLIAMLSNKQFKKEFQALLKNIKHNDETSSQNMNRVKTTPTTVTK